ncbi:chaperone NapD [Campylobacter vicugnae]|uniref:chaperone NapD n=1 Tax=Campylobacter vicugnae TaxID=1660076 RepID=UPI00254D2C51|nr:chaperone NapD [Campylobacter ovis]MDL0094863.1 chaperone NapD [Campylobacter ovis]
MNNISSVVITLMNSNLCEEVATKIDQISNCEVAAKENDKIVAIIESADLDGELATFRMLEQIEGVSTVAMIYSYQDLEGDISKANSNDIGSIVRKIDEMDVKDIKYNGNPNI